MTGRNRIAPAPENRHPSGDASASRGDRKGARIWIHAALEMMAERGDEDIAIEKLARRINMSKGSFYWFFSGLDDLRFRALDHWKEHLNDAVFERVRCFDGTLKDRLVFLTAEIFDSGLGRYDAAIRAWALRDARVDRYMTDVDADRLAFLQDLFSSARPDPGEASFLAHLFYRVLIAESFVRQRPAGMDRKSYLEENIVRMLKAKAVADPGQSTATRLDNGR